MEEERGRERDGEEWRRREGGKGEREKERRRAE